MMMMMVKHFSHEGVLFCSVMDRETSMMSTAADELLEASFSRIKILEKYKDQLTDLSEELEELNAKYNRRGCLKLFSSRSSSPLSCPKITESLEKLQKVEGEINEAQQKTEELLEKLKISANSCEHVVEEILSAMAKRLKVKNQINFSSASARKLIQEMSLCEFQHILEGKVVVGYVDTGKELPLPEVIQMLTELIWKNHVTEASESLRAAADKIKEFISHLFRQFSYIVNKLSKLAQQAGEEQSASETRSGGDNKEESNQPSEESGADDTKKDKDYDASADSCDSEDDDDGDDGGDGGDGDGADDTKKDKDYEASADLCDSGGDNKEESNQPSEESGADDTKKDKDYDATGDSCDGDDDDNSDNKGDDRKNKFDEQKNAGDAGSWVLINFRSIGQKNKIKKKEFDNLLKKNKDVLIITETWVKKEEDKNPDQVLQELLTEDYRFFQFTRENKNGGGVAILFLPTFEGKKMDWSSVNPKHFEYVAAELERDGDQPVLVIGVYRPSPYTSTNQEEFDEFLVEFESLLQEASIKFNGCIILAGDFNIWLDDIEQVVKQKKLKKPPPKTQFMNLLEKYNFEQHVEGPTHEYGHTLDLVFSRNVEVSDLTVKNDDIADHCSIYFNVTPKPKHHRKQFEVGEFEDEDKPTKRVKNSEE